MKHSFDDDWQRWIQVNLYRRCDRQEMAEILIDHEFDPMLVFTTLDLAPDNSTDRKTQRPKISSLSHSGAQRISSKGGIELYQIPGFLNPEACAQLILLSNKQLQRSRTSNEDDGFEQHRTSRTSFLGLIENSLVKAVDLRICQTLGIHSDYSEPLQAQWYEKGEEFKAHTDYFEKEHEGYEQAINNKGQRTWTFMIYLNSVPRGGETKFIHLNYSFQPKAGTAIVWRNINEYSDPIAESLHCGMPVESGFKVILTKWFREKTNSTST